MFIAYFDSDSEEQQFVTEIWSQISPYPFNNRGHTRSIVEWALDVTGQQGADWQREHVVGTALFGTIEEAPRRIMHFHFRHMPPRDQQWAAKRVDEFCESHNRAGIVTCAAGAYLYTRQN